MIFSVQKFAKRDSKRIKNAAKRDRFSLRFFRLFKTFFKKNLTSFFVLKNKKIRDLSNKKGGAVSPSPHHLGNVTKHAKRYVTSTEQPVPSHCVRRTFRKTSVKRRFTSTFSGLIVVVVQMAGNLLHAIVAHIVPFKCNNSIHAIAEDAGRLIFT